MIPSLISLALTPVSAFAGGDGGRRESEAISAAASQVRFIRVFLIIVFLPSRVWSISINLIGYWLVTN